MEYLGDLIQFTGGLVAKIDTISFFIGMVSMSAVIITLCILDDK